MDPSREMDNNAPQKLRVIIEQLEPAIAQARQQGLSVVAGLLVLALQEAQRQLEQE